MVIGSEEMFWSTALSKVEFAVGMDIMFNGKIRILPIISSWHRYTV